MNEVLHAAMYPLIGFFILIGLMVLFTIIDDRATKAIAEEERKQKVLKRLFDKGK